MEHDDLIGINFNPILTIFIEMGYMTDSSEDRKWLKISQTKMTKGIFWGVEKYYMAWVSER